MIREVLAITALFWGVNTTAYASPAPQQSSQYERTEHYQPLAAETLEQAVANLRSHNAHLQGLLDQPALSDEDLVKVHELTYTLELALERVSQVLGETADVLEEVHLGSETMDSNKVRDNGERYLEVMNTLLQ